MNQSNEFNNQLFIQALEEKNYTLINSLVKKGVPHLSYNPDNELDKKHFSNYINTLKFYLRDLYLDGEFYAAQKIISKFSIKRNQSQGETILTKDDLVTIGEYLIKKNSPNIDFFWNQYFKKESTSKFLIRFTLIAIEFKNTNFLSSYDNIKINFKSPLLLKNAINQSFSHHYKNDFFYNLSKFYFVYNPEFNFKQHLLRALKHQFLIRNTESIENEQFKQIESIYATYFPSLYSFKVAQDIYLSLKKKPENEKIYNEYVQSIFTQHSLSIIKEHGSFLFKNNPVLQEKFNLFNKLNEQLQEDLSSDNSIKQKPFKI